MTIVIPIKDLFKMIKKVKENHGGGWEAVRWITFAIVLMILFIFIAGFIYKWGT